MSTLYKHTKGQEYTKAHDSSITCVFVLLPVFVFIKSWPLQKWKSKKFTRHDYSKFDSETFVTKVQETLNQLQINQTKSSEALDLGILCHNRYLKERAPLKQLTKSKKRLARKP